MRLTPRAVCCFVACCAAVTSLGCAPRTITHRPAIRATVTVSPTQGIPKILLFGESESEVRKRFRQRLYVNEENPRDEAYDGVYALVAYNDTSRQVDRLIFDFEQLRRHGVILTVRIASADHPLVLDGTTTPKQFEQRAGCQDHLLRGTRLRPDKHVLVPLSPDAPCRITGHPANDSYRREYTIKGTYTVASFTEGVPQHLFVYEPSLNPENHL